jgi:hypothetical protein
LAINQPPELNLEDPDWRFPILKWLVKGKLSPDQTEARRIARRAKAFVLIDGELYKRGAAVILMRCILRDRGRELLQEIHVGTCGHHAGPRTLVGKAFQQGFYWPTAVADSKYIVWHYEGCQFYAQQTHLPTQGLQTIPSCGLSLSGTSTGWGRSDKRPGASPIFSWRSTSSSNGLRLGL